MAKIHQNAPSWCHCCTYILPWLLLRLARKRATTCKSKQHFEVIYNQPQRIPPRLAMLARFVDPRFVIPAFALFLELGPAEGFSNIERGSFPFAFQYRQGCETPSILVPYTRCSNYRLRSVYACGPCIGGSRSSQLLGLREGCKLRTIYDGGYRLAAILQLGGLATQNEHT